MSVADDGRPMPTICFSCHEAIPAAEYMAHRRHCQADIEADNQRLGRRCRCVQHYCAICGSDLDEASWARHVCEPTGPRPPAGDLSAGLLGFGEESIEEAPPPAKPIPAVLAGPRPGLGLWWWWWPRVAVVISWLAVVISWLSRRG